MSEAISIIIPVYNEEQAIAETVRSITQICKDTLDVAFEIIIVDDGSSDSTPQILQQISSEITVIRHPHNIGYGRSLKDGIQRATHDTIIITDADSTYPFEEVVRLLKEYSRGFDMVVGARQGKHFKGGLLKRLLRRMLRKLVEFCAERNIPDINSGLRVFSKTTILPILPRLCDTFSFTTSMTLAYMMTGKFVSYVEIPYHQRSGLTKVKLFKDSLKTLQYILQAINYYNPLKLFMLFTGLCEAISIVIFIIAIATHLNTFYLLGIGTALVGLIILCVGLLADSLRQTFNR